MSKQRTLQDIINETKEHDILTTQQIEELLIILQKEQEEMRRTHEYGKPNSSDCN